MRMPSIYLNVLSKFLDCLQFGNDKENRFRQFRYFSIILSSIYTFPIALVKIRSTFAEVKQRHLFVIKEEAKFKSRLRFFSKILDGYSEKLWTLRNTMKKWCGFPIFPILHISHKQLDN